MPGPINLNPQLADWTQLDNCDAVDASNWQLLPLTGASCTLNTTNNRRTQQAQAVRVQNGTATGNVFVAKTQAASYDVADAKAILYGVWDSRDYDNVNAGTYYNDSFLAVTNAASSKTFGHPNVTRWQNGPNLLQFGRGDFQDTAATGMQIGVDDTRRLRLRFTGKASGLIDLHLLGFWASKTPRQAHFILQCDDPWTTGLTRLRQLYAAHGWRWQVAYAHGLQSQAHIEPAGAIWADIKAGKCIALNHSYSHVVGMITSMSAQAWTDDYLANAAMMRNLGMESISLLGYRSTDAWVMPFGRLMQDKINAGRAAGSWYMTNGDGGGFHAGLLQFWLNGWGFPVGYNLLASNNSEASVKADIRRAAAAGAVCTIVLHGEGGSDPRANLQQWRWLEEVLLEVEAAGHVVGTNVLEVMDKAHALYGPRPVWW